MAQNAVRFKESLPYQMRAALEEAAQEQEVDQKIPWMGAEEEIPVHPYQERNDFGQLRHRVVMK